ncbi:response regulator [Pedobacter sp. ASV28]|uniref:response regulator n=1 Tax=Pedobacter sp. ASV28 TaxID=2795123 RepID=UPI001E3A8D18|nr:response regulator [Pedobacter sp. ASV28]
MNEIKVLLVEDDAVIQRLVQSFLCKNSCNVLLASNGEDAIKNYFDRKIDFDIIIVDIMMPKMNGLELLVYIKKQEKYSKTKVVGITSGFSSYLKSLCDEKFDLLLTKPLDLDYLLAFMNGKLLC